MKLTNAIKKLEKYGKVEHFGYTYSLTQGNTAVEFMRNGSSENITCIRVRSIHDKDDLQADYSAGTWCDNLSQAIRIARFVEVGVTKSQIVKENVPCMGLSTSKTTLSEFVGIPKFGKAEKVLDVSCDKF